MQEIHKNCMNFFILYKIIILIKILKDKKISKNYKNTYWNEFFGIHITKIFWNTCHFFLSFFSFFIHFFFSYGRATNGIHTEQLPTTTNYSSKWSSYTWFPTFLVGPSPKVRQINVTLSRVFPAETPKGTE